MGEIAGEGGFASMDPPSPPGTHLDTGEFIPYQGPGNFTDIGGFTPSRVGYTTEHGDFIPYNPTDNDELGNHYPVPPGPYNSPIYGEGYIDENHVFHPKYGIDDPPASNQLGPAPDIPHSATLNIPGRMEYSFLPVSLSRIPGIPELNRNYPDGSLRPSVPNQSWDSLSTERDALLKIIKEASPDEVTVIERFKSKVYPEDLHEFLRLIRVGRNDRHFSGKELDGFLDFMSEKLRETRVSQIVNEYVFGLYSEDMSKVYVEVEAAIKSKVSRYILAEFLVPKIEKILCGTNGYAGYSFDTVFLERNKLVRRLTNSYGEFVNPNLEEEFHDAIIDGINSGLKGDALNSYVSKRSYEF